MSTRIRKALVACGLLLVALVFASTGGWFEGNKKGHATEPPQDLSEHPIYSKYRFGEGYKVIDVGTQPLWVPTSVITEAMRRDTLLREALADRGLEVRFHSFLKGSDVNFFLQRGDLEVAIGGDMPALTAAATAPGVVVTSLIQRGFCSIVAKRHMLMRELEGKRIGYAFGSNAHYALLQALASDGVRETDVHMVPLDVDAMPEALAQGRIDAFSAWEPTPSIASARFPDQVVIHRNICSGYLYFSRPFADMHQEAVRQIVASELRAIGWMKERNGNLLKASEWAVLAGRDLTDLNPMLPAERYVELSNSDLLGIASVPAIPRSDLEKDGRLCREFSFLKSLGKIDASLEWERVMSSFDRSILEEVTSRAKYYRLETFDYSGDHGLQ